MVPVQFHSSIPTCPLPLRSTSSCAKVKEGFRKQAKHMEQVARKERERERERVGARQKRQCGGAKKGAMRTRTPRIGGGPVDGGLCARKLDGALLENGLPVEGSLATAVARERRVHRKCCRQRHAAQDAGTMGGKSVEIGKPRGERCA